MQLSHGAIASFQKLYQEKCGVWLNEAEAEVIALNELKRFSLIYKPIPLGDQNLLDQLSCRNNQN